jgi:hypothetical protein
VAKPTLLDLTQRILSAMDSDSVNSISDTVEAEQVADVIRETYLDIVDEYGLKAVHTIFNLDASGTTARPTHMSIPEGYHAIEWVKYDKRESSSSTLRAYTDITYAEPGDFIQHINSRNSDDTEVDVIADPSGVELLIRNDTHPSYWTMFDGTTLVFDSYDSSIDSTLQSSKTQVYGQETGNLTIDDTTVIDLPQEYFNLLRNQARETCFELFKDGAPTKVQRMAERARIRVGRIKTPVAVGQEVNDRVNFGRKSRI